MEPYLEDLPPASTYSPNQPISQNAFLNNNSQLHMQKHDREIPVNLQTPSLSNYRGVTQSFSLLLVLLVLILTGSAVLQNLWSKNNSTSFAIHLGMFQVSYHTESGKPESVDKQ